MKIGLVVNGAPSPGHASGSAYAFATAALDRGHEIVRVFFHHDGVLNAVQAGGDPGGGSKRWAALSAKFGIPLSVCIAAGDRRGVEQENLAPGFELSGLGQLVSLGLDADRLIVFGG